MNEADIIQILQQGATAAVAASSNPALPVAYMDVGFTAPNDQKYLELAVIFTDPVEYWGDERTYNGMMRLILHWPKNDSGVYEPVNMLGSIAGYFTKSRFAPAVQIYTSPSFDSVIDGKADKLYPAKMRFRSFRPS